MRFEWDSEQDARFEAIRQFAASRLQGKADRDGFDREGWNACGAEGVIRHGLPECFFGGQSLGLLSTLGLFEALGRGGADRGLLFALGAHLFGVAVPLALHGDEQQKGRWSSMLANGKIVAALAVTEPGPESGAEPVRAEAVADGFKIRGCKTLITNGPVAGLFLVMAVTRDGPAPFSWSAFLVPRETPGLRVESLDATLGLSGAPMARLIFQDCHVSSSALVGAEHGGYSVFTTAMRWERPGLLAGFIGAAEADLERAVQFANQRRLSSGSLAAQQSLSHRMARMKVRLEAARLLIYRAGWAVDREWSQVDSAVSEAKFMASETVVENALEMLKITAGAGWTDETGAATGLRDSLGTLFGSGTSEVQLQHIAAAMGLKRR